MRPLDANVLVYTVFMFTNASVCIINASQVGLASKERVFANTHEFQ